MDMNSVPRKPTNAESADFSPRPFQASCFPHCVGKPIAAHSWDWRRKPSVT